MAVDELKAEGIILIQPKRTGRDTSDHATLVWSRLGEARALLNGFRESKGLPRLGPDLKTFLPAKRFQTKRLTKGNTLRRPTER
jgi:hypothetical protein